MYSSQDFSPFVINSHFIFHRNSHNRYGIIFREKQCIYMYNSIHQQLICGEFDYVRTVRKNSVRLSLIPILYSTEILILYFIFHIDWATSLEGVRGYFLFE